MDFNKADISALIKAKALALGFNGVGISKAEKIEGFTEVLDSWLNKGYHAGMDYMQRNIDMRSDPRALVPEAKSVISLIISYYPEKLQNYHVPQIAKYAYGTDYHFVLKDKMKELWKHIEIHVPALNGRMFVDSAPVSDKLWAVKAGLGWLGKNSCLINKEIGSFVFICELIVSIELEYDEPYPSNFCGSCTKCIDECPTGAIVQPGIIDSNKCISYQTIENKAETIDAQLHGAFGNRIFGCDTCQDVCPWNKSPLTTQVQEFTPTDRFYTLDSAAWLQMNDAEFNLQFKKSALKRAKLSGLKRNYNFIQAMD